MSRSLDTMLPDAEHASGETSYGMWECYPQLQTTIPDLFQLFFFGIRQVDGPLGTVGGMLEQNE